MRVIYYVDSWQYIDKLPAFPVNYSASNDVNLITINSHWLYNSES